MVSKVSASPVKLCTSEGDSKLTGLERAADLTLYWVGAGRGFHNLLAWSWPMQHRSSHAKGVLPIKWGMNLGVRKTEGMF